MREAAERLSRGEVVRLKVHGHSMEPRIPNGATVTLDPTVPIVIGSFVLAKIRGRLVVHMVGAVGPGRYRIQNIRGGVNGWTRQVYGVVTEIEA